MGSARSKSFGLKAELKSRVGVDNFENVEAIEVDDSERLINFCPEYITGIACPEASP